MGAGPELGAGGQPRSETTKPSSHMCTNSLPLGAVKPQLLSHSPLGATSALARTGKGRCVSQGPQRPSSHTRPSPCLRPVPPQTSLR